MKKNSINLFNNKSAQIRITFLLIAFLLIISSILFQTKFDPARWMTYRNFDVPRQKNFINYLLPGIKDTTSRLKYDFKHKNTTLLLFVLGGLFPAMFILRIMFDMDLRLGIYRCITQWITFAVARLGVFRVAGVCPVKRTSFGIFPFMNCQSCELATGACPLGTFQMSLLNKQIPLILVGQIILVGIISGRAVCGWLCPYGFLSDIFDKLPGRRLKQTLKLTWIKYLFLAVFLVSGISYFFKDKSNFLFYCSFICPVGFYYGILEYAFTSGIHSLSKGFPFFHYMLIYHFLIGVIVIISSMKLGGRFFCKYACPLGTVFGLFSKMSMLKIELNENKCTGCKKCIDVCPMKISVLDQSFLSKSNCILCGRCKKVCPAGKIQYSFNVFEKSVKKPAAQTAGFQSRKPQNMPYVSSKNHKPNGQSAPGVR